jgi:leader peptidase (prepilin peptidase)/N-methyltransferase
MTAVLDVACGLAGVVVGAALEPVVERVPHRVPVWGAIGTDLPALQPARRLLLAAACGALFAGVAIRFGDAWELPAYLVLAAGLLALSAIDLEHYLLPNRIVYPLGISTLVLLSMAAVADGQGTALVRSVLAGAAAFAAFFTLHLVSPRSMGYGDVRLSLVLGLALGWLGWGEVVVGLFLGFLYGAVIGIVLIATHVRTRKQAVPFGPFLAAGSLTAVFVGDAIVRWYRR